MEDLKRKLLSKGVHLYFPKEPPLENGWKGGSSPKKGTAQPHQWDVNVDHEKSLGNYLYDGIDIYIYIYIYYDGSQYKDILFICNI